MQLSDFGTDSFDSFFRPYRVHQDGVKSSQVTGNEIVCVTDAIFGRQVYDSKIYSRPH